MAQQDQMHLCSAGMQVQSPGRTQWAKDPAAVAQVATVAQIWSLAWEPHMPGGGKKKKKKKKSNENNKKQ